MACEGLQKEDIYCETPEAKVLMESTAHLLGAVTTKCTPEVTDFASWLLSELEDVVSRAGSSATGFNQATLWSRYHNLRCSSTFRQRWQVVLHSIGLKVDPVLSQVITSRMFDCIIKVKLPVVPQDIVQVEPGSELTYEEENAIRYVGGYIVKSLKQTVKNEDVLCALNDLVDDGTEEAEESEEWTGMIDRGGLTYITTSTFQYLCAIEHVLRGNFMNVKRAHEFDCCKEKIKKSIESDADVQLCWTTVSTDMDDDTAETLSSLLVDKWISIRGFSFASGIMEQYKQQKKEGTQKAKRLRQAV